MKKIRCTKCTDYHKRQTYPPGVIWDAHINLARFFFIAPQGQPVALCTGCYYDMFGSKYSIDAWKNACTLTKEEYLVAKVMQS